MLGETLFRPEFWHIQRDTIAKGAAVGLFWAFIPVPMQMLLGAITSIVLRCNIPASLAMCWVTNPFTIPFFFFMNYRVGAFLTFSEPIDVREIFRHGDVFHSIRALWLPLGVGSLTMACVVSVSGYFVLKGFWRLAVVRKRSQRARKRKLTERQ